jgi:hypothetical protein
VAHWRSQVLIETDPWKKFLFTFIGLEILTHKLFDQFRDPLVERLRLASSKDEIETASLPLAELILEPSRAPLRARFALVAIELYPETAADDTRRFAEAKTARDELAHGSLQSEAQLPIGMIEELFKRYLDGALKRLLLNLPASASWDADKERS